MQVGEEIIRNSAALRGERRFDEAIELIENNADSIESDIKVNAWLEAFYAAKEKGDQSQTRKFAALVAAEDPDIPGIQDYLR